MSIVLGILTMLMVLSALLALILMVLVLWEAVGDAIKIVRIEAKERKKRRQNDGR